ncbi:MAG: hypothetical protein F9K25_05270 [Candidatus Contendobacter sp.]|nr:MAG: hypothetical protein F9K25_05270 [Candidatus Contendobacter sp.]
MFLLLLLALSDRLGARLPLIRLSEFPGPALNPIERCWGSLEQHWNGTKLVDINTMLEWAKNMTWKGIHPIVKLSRTVYQQGISLSKAAMQAVEARLERNPLLPKWDILIQPA